MLNHDNNNKR